RKGRRGNDDDGCGDAGDRGAAASSFSRFAADFEVGESPFSPSTEKFFLVSVCWPCLDTVPCRSLEMFSLGMVARRIHPSKNPFHSFGLFLPHLRKKKCRHARRRHLRVGLQGPQPDGPPPLRHQGREARGAGPVRPRADAPRGLRPRGTQRRHVVVRHGRGHAARGTVLPGVDGGEPAVHTDRALPVHAPRRDGAGCARGGEGGGGGGREVQAAQGDVPGAEPDPRERNDPPGHQGGLVPCHSAPSFVGRLAKCCVVAWFDLWFDLLSLLTWTSFRYRAKPENIFIKNDQYKLGDFGLVSNIENHGDVEEGDSRYMSRELLSGDLDDLTKVSSLVRSTALPDGRGVTHDPAK
ncbi:hypothetical protein THAOC_03883, partial [Thalassiosira oceanica]